MNKHNTALAVCFVFVTGLLLIAGRQSFFRDPGTFWHIRTGELILKEQSFINYDPYSCTFGGQPWTPYEWFGEVTMAIVHSLAGIDGILIISCLVLAMVFTFLFHRLLLSGLHPVAAIVITLLALACSSSHFHARPHLITILLLAIAYAMLVDIEAGRLNNKCLLIFIPMVILWTNIHGGVLGGLCTIGIVFTGWLVYYLLGVLSPVKSDVDIRRIIILAAVLPSMTLINPYGYDVPATWLQIMSMSELPLIIKEHSPVTISEMSSWPFFIYGALYLVVICTVQKLPRITWLIPIIWFVLACDRVRHAPLFAVTATIGIIDLLPYSRIGQALYTHRPDYYQLPTNTNNAQSQSKSLLVIMIITLISCSSLLELSRRGCVSFHAAFPKDVWPVDLLPYLHHESLSTGKPIPIFNEYEYGGFLIYFTPQFRPFVDDRCEVYGGTWLKRYDDAAKGDATVAMSEWSTTYPQFTYALVRYNSGFDSYFCTHQDWTTVAKDENAILYKRIR